MRRFIFIAGWCFWTPAAIGVTARWVVDGYRGEASHMLWIGLSLVGIALIWSEIAKRLRPSPAQPVQSTIYDWLEDDDSIEFFARRDDGSEYSFTVRKGATVTRGSV